MVKGCISHDETGKNLLSKSLPPFLIRTLKLSTGLPSFCLSCSVCLTLPLSQYMSPLCILPPGQYVYWASEKTKCITHRLWYYHTFWDSSVSTRSPIKPTLLILISGEGSFNMARASLIMLHTAAISFNYACNLFMHLILGACCEKLPPGIFYPGPLEAHGLTILIATP